MSVWKRLRHNQINQNPGKCKVLLYLLTYVEEYYSIDNEWMRYSKRDYLNVNNDWNQGIVHLVSVEDFLEN